MFSKELSKTRQLLFLRQFCDKLFRKDPDDKLLFILVNVEDMSF